MKTFKKTFKRTLKLTGITLFVFTALATLGCGSSHSGLDPARVRSDSNVLLAEAGSGDCLNLEKYFDVLLSIREGVPAQQISTQFSASGSARRSFMLLLAYRTFNFEQTDLENITEVIPVKQDGCESIVFSEGGPVFKITAHGSEFVTAENEEGDTYTYRWLSPSSMKIDVGYTTSDYGCSEKSKIKVKTSKMVYWGKEAMRFESGVDADLVAADYLDMVSEAIGVESGALYSSEAKLSSKKLETLATTPPREDLFDCL